MQYEVERWWKALTFALEGITGGVGGGGGTEGGGEWYGTNCRKEGMKDGNKEDTAASGKLKQNSDIG